MTRIVRSFRIEEKFWREVKKYCVDIGTDLTSLINDLLRNELDGVNNLEEESI